MKHITQLTNVDRAKLLHDLYPQPIKDYLEYAKGFIGYLQAHQKELKSTWENDMFSFEYWLSLALDMEKRIDRYHDKLCTSSRLFSDQLFNGMLAVFAVDTLLKFTNDDHCKDVRFKHLAKGILGGRVEENPLNTAFEKRFQQLTDVAVNFIKHSTTTAKRIVLNGNTSPGNRPNPCVVRFPTTLETVNIEEIEQLDDDTIVIRGAVTGSKQIKSIDINLQFLDPESAVVIAEYLSKKPAS